MSEPTDIIQTVTDIDRGLTDRVAWVVEQIASNAYEPGEDGQPWAGRIDCVARAMTKFGIKEPEADRLVTLAAEELHRGGGDSGAQVRRRLMLNRLNTIRAIVVEQMATPRSTMVWQFVPEKRGGRVIRDDQGRPVMLKVPKREVVHRGVDVQSVRLLLDIERAIAELMDMNSGETGEEMLARIFAKIEEDSQGNQTTTTTVSVEQVKKASPAAQAVILKALEQHGKRTRAKAVTSKPAEADPDPAERAG